MAQTHLSDPEQILAQAAAAADAAVAILPDLERELQELEVQLQKKRRQVEAVRALADRFKTPTVARPRVRLSEMFDELQAEEPVKTATADLERAMREAGPIGAAEMINWIKEKTGRMWAQSTVYNQLKKGKDAKRYINEDNKWRLAEGFDLV
jgi:hypothetical protein